MVTRTPILAIDPNMIRADGTIPARRVHMPDAAVGDAVIACEEEGGDYWDATVERVNERILDLRLDWGTHRERP